MWNVQTNLSLQNVHVLHFTEEVQGGSVVKMLY